MKEMFFEDDIDDSKYLGHLFGLGTSHVVAPANSSSTPVSTADSRAAAAAVAAATIDLNDDASSTKSSGAGTPQNSAMSGSSQNKIAIFSFEEPGFFCGDSNSTLAISSYFQKSISAYYQSCIKRS